MSIYKKTKQILNNLYCILFKLSNKNLLSLKNVNKLFIFAFLGIFIVSATCILYTHEKPVNAATNNTVNFQARVLTNTGALVPDGNYHVEFKLYNQLSGGSPVWTETYTTGNLVTVKNGYVSAALGSLTAFPASINWDQELWLSMNIGGKAGSAVWDGEMSPRMKVTSVPFAQSAAKLQNTNGANTSTLQLLAPTSGNQVFQIQDQGAAGTFNLCIQNSSACGFAPSSGGGNYIQNTTANQNGASFNIQSSAIGNVTAKFRAFTGQTADILQIRNSGDTATVFSVSPTGNTTVGGTLGVTGVTTLSNTLNVSSGTSQGLLVTNSSSGPWALSLDRSDIANSRINIYNNGGTFAVYNNNGTANTLNLSQAGLLSLPQVGGGLNVAGAAAVGGVLTVGNNSGDETINVSGDNTGSERISFQEAGSTTWSVGAIGAGANPGFAIQRYNAGAYVDAPLTISNTTGALLFSGATSVGGSNTFTVGTGATTLGGTLGVTGLSTFTTLGAANTSTFLCRNSSNQLATCNTTGAGAAFVQGGNSFGATAVLGTNDNNQLDIETNGTTRWSVTTAGILQSNGAQTIQSSTGNLTLATAGGNGNILLMPNGTGNVGVGTTSPSLAKLQVESSDNTTMLALSATGGNARLYMGTDSSSNALIYTQNNVDLRMGVNSSPTALVIKNGGNVGIGETSPNARLQVTSNTSTTVGQIIKGAASQTANLQEWQNSSGVAQASVGPTGKISTMYGLDISRVAAPASISVALINSAGNVNAGTHYYHVTYVTALGETNAKVSSVITTDAANGQVTVTIPTSSDSRVIARKIYRTKAGETSYSSNSGLLATINDNVTTTYVDNTADASLTGTGAYWRENTTSKYITMDGSSALFTGITSLFAGTNAGATTIAGTTTGGYNVGLGTSSLANLTSGVQNVGIGFGAMSSVTSGSDNIAIGYGPNSSLTSGSLNVAIGRNALLYNQTGSYNTAIGYGTLLGSVGNSNSNNTAIGYAALNGVTTGNNNIGLGMYSGYFSTNQNNELFINSIYRNNRAGDVANSIIYGVQDATPANQILSLGGGGKVGINTSSPANTFDVNGGLIVSGSNGLGLGSIGNTGKNRIDTAGTAPYIYRFLDATDSIAGLTVSAISNSGAYVQSGASANTFTGATTFSAAGTALSVTNNASVGGTLAVTTSITTGSTSFNLLNTTATTVNAFGATTSLNMGAATGTATFGNGGAFTLRSTTGQLTVQSGSGTVSLGTSTALTANGALDISSNTTNAISLDSGTTGTVNIGTNANAKTVNIGSATGASITNIQGGTGTAAGDLNLFTTAGGIINIGTNNVTNKVLNLGSVGGTVQASTINIATTNANAVQTVNIGNTASNGSSVSLQGGTSATAISLQAKATGSIVLGSVNNNNLSLNTAATTGTTTIGGTATSGIITLGQSSGASNTINIGNVAGNTFTQTINMGNSATAGSVTNVSIGSTIGTSNTTIQGGSGNIVLNSAGTLELKTSSTTRIQVDNQGGIGIGASSNANSLMLLNRTYSAATGAPQYGEYLTTRYSVADTDLKQGLRVNTESSIASGIMQNILGVASVGRQTAAGTVTESSALWARNDAWAGGNIVNAYGLRIADGDIISGGAGTITNQYGLFVDNFTSGSTTNYPIYVNGASGSLFKVDNSGFTTHSAGVLINTTSNSAFQIQDSGANNLFTADTTNGRLIVGSRPDSGGGTTSWNKVSQATAGTLASGGTSAMDSIRASVVYDGSLYVSTSKSGAAEIYRYDGGTNWTKVSQATPGTIASGGTSAIDEVMSMTVFNGKLFVGTRKAISAEVYRYDGGTNWTKVSSSTAGKITGYETDANKVEMVSSMVVYNGDLYIGVGTSAGGAKAAVYRYRPIGGPTDWGGSPISGAVPGNISGLSTGGLQDYVQTMAVYNGKLFIGTASVIANSAGVYSYDGSTWLTEIGTFGNLAGVSISGIRSLAVYNGKLFASSNGSSGGNVAYYQPDHVWRGVTNAAGQINNGGTTNIGSVEKLYVYAGKLFAGTSDAANISEVYYIENLSGVWTKVSQTTPGTVMSGGTTAITGIFSMAEFNGSLYVGTSKASQAEVLKYQISTNQSYQLFFNGTTGAQQNGNLNGGSISFNANSSGNTLQGGGTGSFIFSHGIISATGAYDVAEDYPTRDDSLVVGDIVSIDSKEGTFVRKTTDKDDNGILGVYSSKPGLRLSQQDDTINGGRAVPVALAGRVLVNLTNENGPIKAGDTIVMSSTPGYGMRSNGTGQIIGKALEDFNSTTGQAMVYVNIGKEYLTMDQILSSPDIEFNNIKVKGSLAVNNNLSVTGDVTIGGNLTVRDISVANLTVNGHIITAGNAPTIVAGAAAGVADAIAKISAPVASVDGNDTSGTITVVAGANTLPGDLVEVTFNSQFSKTPKVVLNAGNEQTANLKFYRDADTGKFRIKLPQAPVAGQTYTFDYFVMQ